tara:strand:- start:175 stop:357 length:183 start_codon:yes stop_codon:yes gene_type:complete
MNFIFSTALPRSGTGLLTKSLQESKKITTAVGPDIKIYRFHKDHLVRKYSGSSLKKYIKS